MDKIYVLITGAYSDWKIDGFVTSEEEAIKICLEKNKNVEDSWDTMYYKAVSKFDEFSKERLKNIHNMYEYRVRAWHTDDGWIFQEADSISINGVTETHPNVEILKGGFASKNSEYAIIHLDLPVVDRKKAIKIAQDMLYKKVAERKGISI